MSKSSSVASILVAHGDEGIRTQLVDLTTGLGHNVTGSVESCGSLARTARSERPDLIVSGLQFPDGNSLDTLIEISREIPMPAIIISQNNDVKQVEKAMDDHVMAYLVPPVSVDTLGSTIMVVLRRFAEFEDLRQENEELKDALATRKKLERAKGILMAKEGISEEKAYLRLRNLATGNRVKLGAVAEEIIQSSIEKNQEAT